MSHRKPLHILHALAPAPFGGLESVVRGLAAGHMACGHRVTVAALVQDNNDPFVEALKGDGVSVVAAPTRGRDYRRERREFGEMLSRSRPDVVHSHGYHTDILTLPVARVAGIPTVSTLHGFIGGDMKLRLYEWLQMRSVRNAGAVVAVSRGVEARLRARGVAQSKLHLIRNANSRSAPMMSRAAAREALGIPRDEYRIAWIGRLSAEKGPDIMLASMDLLRNTAATLSFVGEGPARVELETRASQLGISDRVTFHGAITDASRLLPAFDLLALSSRTEGTPMVILEAMAAETPIVATRVGGVPDILSPAEALLVESERPDLLAAAIKLALYDTESAGTRANAARRRLIAEFGQEAWLESYLSLYESLTIGRGPQ